MSAVESAVEQPISLAHESILATASIKHPLLAEVVTKNGLIDVRSTRDHCIVEFLAGIVISQQLSARASSTIWSRVCDLGRGKNLGFRQLFVDENYDELCACGISRAKTKAIINMTALSSSGEIDDEVIRESCYEEIGKGITSLWGFGQWSADMVAMFFAKLPDVWPESDVALIRGLRILAPGEEPDEAAFHYSPHRTYLARHIWKALDTGLLIDDAA